MHRPRQDAEESCLGEADRQDAANQDHQDEPDNALEVRLRVERPKARLGSRGLPQRVVRQEHLAAWADA